MPRSTARAEAAVRSPTAVAARLDGVEVALGGHPVLHDVDLLVPAARLTALVGPNGAGKSTLIEVLAGVRTPRAGRVTREATSVAFVPQRAAVPPRLPVTVREVVTIGAWGGAGPWRRVGRDGRRRVEEAILVLGLDRLARRPFASLSGGERQRALLAQGLARGAALLLIDEPTTALDADSVGHVCAAIDHERAAGTAVVCVSHDRAVIDRADGVVRLAEGRVLTADPSGVPPHGDVG